MVVTIVVLSAFLLLSLLGNAFLYFRHRQTTQRLHSLQNQKGAPTLEVKQLLHDLTRRGRSVIDIKVLDLDGLMYWNK